MRLLAAVCPVPSGTQTHSGRQPQPRLAWPKVGWSFIQTLLAVAVGGAISFCTAYYLDRRRERAARARDVDAAMHELRAAARLVRDELLDGMAAAEAAVDDGTWPPAPISTAQWQAQAPVLAKHMPHGSWASVCIAFGRVLTLNQAATVRPGLPLHGMERDMLVDDLEEMQQAEEALLWAAGDQLVRLELQAQLAARQAAAA